MPRPRSVNLHGVLEGARTSFARGGLRRTLMSEIAVNARVSTGSLYNVAVSKEALFLACFLTPAELQAQVLPMPVPSVEEIIDRVGGRLRAAMSLPLLTEALTRPRADDPRAELLALIAERYDATADNWQLLAAVEQTAKDIPVAFHEYFEAGRGGQVEDLAAYLRLRAESGQLRPVDPVPAARFVLEAVTWWAWHRREDQQPLDLDDAAARALVQDLLASALLA